MHRHLPSLTAALLLVATLACAGTTQNLRVEGLPQYTCPSSTPRPTHTQPATSLPTYPPYFAANLSAYQVVPNANTVTVQWIGQSAGEIRLSYAGLMTVYPYTWTGSGGPLTVDTIPGPAHSGAYMLAIPLTVTYATVTLSASSIAGSSRTFAVTRVTSPLDIPPNPPPGGAPGAITATPRPTYTPWPTPTEYVRTHDYFTGDAVYTPRQASGLRLRFRVTAVESLPAAPDEDGSPRSVFVWTVEVKNVGSVEYDLFPAGQMYVSTVTLASGAEVEGVWGASLEAAETAGLTPDYILTDLQPGDSRSFTLAAFGPPGTARRIAYVLDVTARSAAQPTLVPGQNVVSWINEVNTVCTGEIEEP